MNNSNKLSKNQQLNEKQGLSVAPTGYLGAASGPTEPYLTNTDKLDSSDAFAPVFVKFTEADYHKLSLQLFNEVKDLYYHDKKALLHFAFAGLTRFRQINDNTIVVYRNFNRLGNSNAGFALAMQNSNTDKARFASKNLAQERALANVDIWAYFVTLTFDKTKQDRNNFELLKNRVTNWYRRRNIKYFIVPELHKKGGIHFHCLCSTELGSYLSDFKDTAPKALKNPWIKNAIASGREVRNCADLAEVYGFNTVEPIKNAEACVNYMTKYVLKTFDDENFERISRRRFFMSKGLKCPQIIMPHQVDLQNFDLVATSGHTEKCYLKRANYRIRKISLDSMSRPSPRTISPPFSFKQDMNEQAIV